MNKFLNLDNPFWRRTFLIVIALISKVLVMVNRFSVFKAILIPVMLLQWSYLSNIEPKKIEDLTVSKVQRTAAPILPTN